MQSAVEAALYALGDGNWKMGEGIQVGKGAKEEDDGSIVEHFIRELVSSNELVPEKLKLRQMTS